MTKTAAEIKLDAIKTFVDQCNKQVGSLPPEYRNVFLEFAKNITVMVIDMNNAEAYVMLDKFK